MCRSPRRRNSSLKIGASAPFLIGGYMNKKDLERGYIDTGYIPEEGDNLGQIEKMVG